MVMSVTEAGQPHVKRRTKSGNLDFDARVPIPFSVFPSSYRSDAASETTQTRVEGEVQLDRTSRVEREDTRTSAPLPDPRVYGKEEVNFQVKEEAFPQRQHQHHEQQNYAAEVDLTRERYPDYQQTSVRYEERPQVYDQAVENQLDITEREYRRRTSPYDVSYDRRYQPVDSYEYQSAPTADVSYDRAYQPQSVGSYRAESYPRREVELQQPTRYSVPTEVKVAQSTVRDSVPAPAPRKMGYYDDEGQYHSFRRGVERAADRVLHPFHHHEHEVVSDERGPARFTDGVREEVRVVEPRDRGSSGETVPIPCHFIRIGDILILQGRPCQVIRISVSPQTGQHRYLGVDLFTRQLQEESSFVANPSPSVVVQTMLGPVYKTYRILDLRDDARLVAMTETGDVKQGLPVITQGNLFKRIRDAFADGRGSVRALVINDGGRELVVDFKVIHGSRL
ncbi:hypothetical protein N7492_000387 [Penicillium capsulatum]|uniref:Translation initiation factor 5A-like N-terminal domain-containing protein n=1 Tax=Penicillium capsulatum TaxID=69766 RepID=A0A9W9LYH5_9EURO|nr:hypothetical protein N7492_000387 [Penicillium capsulatum]KAJ6130549.1 hypothetical protein N7512_003329 [Penicillium capsulatum]